MRVREHQRPAGRSEETTEKPSACCEQESFSCLNPPSRAVLQVLTVLWEDHVDEAFKRQLAKYNEPVIECGKGWHGAFSVEAGSRSFAAWCLSDKPSSKGKRGARSCQQHHWNDELESDQLWLVNCVSRCKQYFNTTVSCISIPIFPFLFHLSSCPFHFSALILVSLLRPKVELEIDIPSSVTTASCD